MNQSNQHLLQAPIYLSSDELSNLAAGIPKEELHSQQLSSNGWKIMPNKNIQQDESGHWKNSKVPDDAFDKDDQLPSYSTDEPDDSFPPAEQQLARRLHEILSSVKYTKPSLPSLYDSPVGSIVRLDSEEEDDFDLALPGNINSNLKFERQERLDVKKPGPWFSVNNFAFGDDEERNVADIVVMAASPSDMWDQTKRDDSVLSSDEGDIYDLVQDVPTYRDPRKSMNNYRAQKMV